MPKVEPVTSIRVTRSRSSTPAAQASMKYQQANNPLSLRRALGRRHSEVEAATSAGSVAQDMLSSSDRENSGFRIIPTISTWPFLFGTTGTRPPTERLAETSEEEGEVHFIDWEDEGLLAAILTLLCGIKGPSDSASDLLVVIGRQKRQLQMKTATLGRKKQEIKALKERIGELDEEAEERQSNLTQSQKNEVQYRNWWLN
ncbi:hypothetical protein BKA70DRAFT_1238732 [Coprinopsis sp. MPI-PUGE-AT-0042]|nr:hypothetical protein BKA70DRAFT_1238732 [Coprinopsis sp. MPI-PUGE-AT-0042]